jgi:4-hydroxysphinganine ceramide fatty acyl 2-hydroxylase
VQFIEEPKHLINPVRDVILFNSPYLEVFSKTPWYAIPIAWAPFLIYYMSHNELDLISTVFWMFTGIVNWSLLEYVIHRFVFHGEDYWLPESNFAYVAHFLLHGIHHAFP